MPRETIILRCKGEHWRAEGAACVLAWLAYPEATEKDRLRRIEFKNYAALAWFLRMAMADLDWASQPQEIPPFLLLLSAKKIPGVLARAEKKIVPYRLLAGDMLGQLTSRYLLEEGLLSELTFPKETQIQYLSENGEIAERTVQKGTRLKFKMGVEVDDDYRAYPPTRKVIEGDRIRKVTTNMLAASLAKRLCNPPEGWGIKAGKWNDKRVMKQVWAPSKPVAHLGMAILSHIITNWDKILPEMDALLKGSWLESVLLNAEANRQEAIQVDSIAMEEAETVQLLFAEGSGKIPSPSKGLVLP